MTAPPQQPRGLASRFVNLFPPGQFFSYLAVGAFNTLFGYATYVFFFTIFSSITSARHPALIAPLAALVSTPLNITVAYFGYKIFVFKTRGNYLAEWFKCFGVYGVGMLPGLIALSAITRLLQALIHRHADALHHLLVLVESHLSGRPLAFADHIAHGPIMAGYIAGALVQGFTVIASFIGHKKVTFATKSVASQMH
jgi:putative flippase GtrA